jgi:hypothetical protein
MPLFRISLSAIVKNFQANQVWDERNQVETAPFITASNVTLRNRVPTAAYSLAHASNVQLWTGKANGPDANVNSSFAASRSNAGIVLAPRVDSSHNIYG